MELKEKLNIEYLAYIKKYGRNPNVIFISHNLYAESSLLPIYGIPPKHLWECDVFYISTPNQVKFAENNDVKKGVARFQVDSGWDAYVVDKFKASIGGIGGGKHIRSVQTEVDPIKFTGEELEAYLAQS